MTTLRACCCALLAATLAACAGVRVTHDFDPDANFSRLRTWTWMPGAQPEPTGDPRLDSPLIDARIRAAVEDVLVSRGHPKVASVEEADFLVDYHLSVERRLDARSIGTGIGYGHYHRWGTLDVETVVREYEEGTLVIDIADARARRLVWRGWGTRRLRRYPTPEQTTRTINETVAEVLEQFPPR